MKLKFRAEPKDIVIFVVFMIFCFYIVSIGVLNALSILLFTLSSPLTQLALTFKLYGETLK